jgi:hypothetical protein
MKGAPVDRHLLYGIAGPSVDLVAQVLDERLGRTFHQRESDYFGVYRHATADSAEIMVVSQPDPEGDPLEDDFADFSTLVYIDGESDLPDLDGLRIGRQKLEKLRKSL